jgi:hypothetical protein
MLCSFVAMDGGTPVNELTTETQNQFKSDHMVFQFFEGDNLYS